MIVFIPFAAGPDGDTIVSESVSAVMSSEKKVYIWIKCDISFLVKEIRVLK